VPACRRSRSARRGRSGALGDHGLRSAEEEGRRPPLAARAAAGLPRCSAWSSAPANDRKPASCGPCSFLVTDCY
jgi:hypothetical protein